MGMHAASQGPEVAPDGEVAGVTVAEATPRAADVIEEKQEAAVEAFARDREGLTEENERDALDYILGARPPREYDVKVTVDTDTGQSDVIFVIRAQDGLKIDKIEQRHVSEQTGRLDQYAADAEIVGDATVMLVSPTTGRKVNPRDESFRTMQVKRVDTDELGEITHPSAAAALQARFRDQLGLLSGVAREVRRVSGFDVGRVAEAKRRLVAAAGN